MINVPPLVQRLSSIVGTELPVAVELMLMNRRETDSQVIGDFLGQKTF